jgi:glycosyltransferase involved in cell wall biosynthesis
MKTANPATKSIKKKILLISYHFPPSAAIGGLRTSNFAKYLPSFGWIPHVLTLEDHYLNAPDWERLKDLGAIKIIKAGQLPTLRDAYLLTKKSCNRILKRNPIPQKKLEMPDSSWITRSNTETLSEKLKRYLISLFLTFPDLESGWILPAIFQAVREIRNEKINCFLTTLPPISVHLVGTLVKMMTGVKWVADFRDPWMTGRIKFPSCALSNKIESWLEREVIRKADLVIFNVQQMRDAYKSKYATETASKFIHIPNSIDHRTFSQVRPLKKYEKFTLSYVGSFYWDRSPEPIFDALSQLIREGRVDPEEVRVKLVGTCQYVKGEPIAKMIRAYDLDPVVQVLEAVPYLNALEIIRQSHLALLFAPNQPLQIPGKVYDYIGAGAKILAIAEKSATADLIHSTNCGKTFHPLDIENIKEFIFETMANRPSIDPDYSMVISQFDARRITESLANHLNRIVV